MKELIFDDTQSQANQFQSGFRVWRMDGKVKVEYLTNIQGHYDKEWILTENQWVELPYSNTKDKCMAIEQFNEPDSKRIVQ